MSSRTLIRNPSLDSDNIGGFDLCIDDDIGVPYRPHFHQFGHDFPMNRIELLELKTQIEKALKETEKNGV